MRCGLLGPRFAAPNHAKAHGVKVCAQPLQIPYLQQQTEISVVVVVALFLSTKISVSACKGRSRCSIIIIIPTGAKLACASCRHGRDIGQIFANYLQKMLHTP
jgi:hypothetical protein